jgi:hypothetical protein
MAPPNSAFRMARVETAVALGLLCGIGTTIAAVDVAARNKPLALWMYREREELDRRSCNHYVHKGFYDSVIDQMLLDELPAADYSQGGVCLIGNSSFATATKLWALPPEQKTLIHNFAQPGACHTMQFANLRNLVEHEGLLRAGADKTLVIFGASYHSAACIGGPQDPFVVGLERHGFFVYDPAGEIRPVPVHPILRWIETERARMPGFLTMCCEFARVHLQQGLGLDPAPRRIHHPEQYNRFWQKLLGDNWEQRFSDQVAEFGRMCDYVRDHGAHLAVVILPLASWDDNLPFEQAYNSEITELCHARGVPLYDWSQMLDDEEFGDASHVNFMGMEKLHAALLEMALTHLRETGALP